MTSAPTIPEVHISVTSSEMAVRDALSKLLTALGPLDLDVEDAGTVELVMAEAMNNIVEHAYPEGDVPGPIRLACAHSDDGLHIKITDSGRPMPDGTTPVGRPTNLDVDFCDLPEGGFGWFLIQDLAKEVEYRRVDNDNQLTFRLPVGT